MTAQLDRPTPSTRSAAPEEPGRRGRGRRRPPRRYLAVVVLAALALVGALVAPVVYGMLTDNGTAKDRIEADPPPTLFAADTVARVDELATPQAAEAQRLMQQWWARHGTTRDDAAFQAWVEQTLPAPPPTAARKQEMTEVEQLERQRTVEGIRAATWLEAYGKKDVWKLAAHDQAELLSTTAGDDRKNAVDDILSMSKTVADDLGAKFQVSAPYVLEPSLRTDHQVAPGDVCPCSYPSRHASSAAASRTFLAGLSPQLDSDYQWWQDQIDYSRLYMAGHVASDLVGGTLLGDMIGDYFLVTRGHLDPATLTPAG